MVNRRGKRLTELVYENEFLENAILLFNIILEMTGYK